MTKKIKCPYCSEQILRTAKKCKHCGEFIDKDSRVEEVADGVVKTTGSIFWKIFKIIIWINVVVLGLILVLLVLTSSF
jgi:uncharacterized membrane protein YvbJ